MSIISLDFVLKSYWNILKKLQELGELFFENNFLMFIIYNIFMWETTVYNIGANHRYASDNYIIFYTDILAKHRAT